MFHSDLPKSKKAFQIFLLLLNRLKEEKGLEGETKRETEGETKGETKGETDGEFLFGPYIFLLDFEVTLARIGLKRLISCFLNAEFITTKPGKVFNLICNKDYN